MFNFKFLDECLPIFKNPMRLPYSQILGIIQNITSTSINAVNIRDYVMKTLYGPSFDTMSRGRLMLKNDVVLIQWIKSNHNLSAFPESLYPDHNNGNVYLKINEGDDERTVPMFLVIYNHNINNIPLKLSHAPEVSSKKYHMTVAMYAAKFGQLQSLGKQWWHDASMRNEQGETVFDIYKQNKALYYNTYDIPEYWYRYLYDNGAMKKVTQQYDCSICCEPMLYEIVIGHKHTDFHMCFQCYVKMYGHDVCPLCKERFNVGVGVGVVPQDVKLSENMQIRVMDILNDVIENLQNHVGMLQVQNVNDVVAVNNDDGDDSENDPMRVNVNVNIDIGVGIDDDEEDAVNDDDTNIRH